jgi:thymidylate synthase (FAD)
MNMHNLMHFLHLRMEDGAQMEIRDYAQAIYDLVAPLAPMCFNAFRDFRVDAMHLTGPEIRNLRDGTPIKSKGEQNEWAAKRKVLGI